MNKRNPISKKPPLNKFNPLETIIGAAHGDVKAYRTEVNGIFPAMSAAEF
jgi:hypothetical protein